MDLKRIMEAVLFASPRPLTLKALSKKLDSYPLDEIHRALTDLIREYNFSDRAVEIVEVSGGFQMRTKIDYTEWAKRFVKEKDIGLTRTMLEALSIVAYKQPITKREIDSVRGVDSTRAVKYLLEKRLIEIAGRNGDDSKKIAFRTTYRFLEVYGLRDISDLPTIKEIEALEK
jgi:segregation and condensation protein B